MASCVTFPVRQTDDLLFYVTDIIMTPLLFGVGLMGSLLGLIVFNHRHIRRESAIYVYLCGLSAMDALTFLTLVPSFIQNTETLPPNITYSRPMAYITTSFSGVESIFRHSANWMITWAIIIRCAGAKEPFQKESRLTRISVSRVVVFLIMFFCILVNISSFFETRVVEVLGHCFAAMSLWNWEITEYGQGWMAEVIFPWAIAMICYVLPVFIMIVCILTLACHTGWKSLFRKPLMLVTVHNEEQRDWQLSASLVTVTSVYVILELPNVVCYCMLAILGRGLHQNVYFHSISLVANAMSLFHAAINVIIFGLHNADFRKALGRSCCCLCNTTDDYYEPYICCPCCHKRKRKVKTTRENIKKSKTINETEKDSSKYSDVDSQASLHGNILLKDGWL